MFNLRVALLGAAILAGALSSANAADVYARGESLKDSPVEMPAIAWAGFYAGLHAGGAFGDEMSITLSQLGFSDTETSDVENTWLAGVHVGYNWQMSNIVLGIEGSFSALGGKREVEFAGFTEQDDNWLASIRGRLGYAAGPVLIYATGGVAFLNSEGSFTALDANFESVAPFDGTTTGWVAGGGVEYKLGGNWSLGVEGLYYSFEDDATVPQFGFNDEFDYERDFWTVQARLTYHFGDLHGESLK